MKYFIKTFGCQQNVADSERIAGAYEGRGWLACEDPMQADVVVINTCSVKQSAEDRAYAFIKKMGQRKKVNDDVKIVMTGCMVGGAVNDKSGQLLSLLKKRLPEVDEFLPIAEVGFDTPSARTSATHAWVPITSGCNNYCTFCVVPFTRGKEYSRSYNEIISQIAELAKGGYREVTLLGQNVNSYGADLVLANWHGGSWQLPNGKKVDPVMVRHLGRYRIPTLFPYLLEAVCQIDGIKKVSFMTSNPWDFSDELIATIAQNPKVDRQIHLPVQSGDNQVLSKMNRWYTREEYLDLIARIRAAVPGVTFGTDIIVGFPGETEDQFANTVKLCRQVGFVVAYVSEYSPRPQTSAAKNLPDDIPHAEKNRRFHLLDNLVNTTIRRLPARFDTIAA